MLCMTPKKYVEKIEAVYKCMFTEKSQEVYSFPLEKKEYPEMDTTKFLDINSIKKYQLLIGAL